MATTNMINGELGKAVLQFLDVASNMATTTLTEFPNMAIGSTYWASDTKTGYVWTGAAWVAV